MTGDGARVKIDELKLAGFRAFENARLELDDLTVLVGRNGAGKSTLIDALEFLRESLADTLQNALERRGGFSAIQHKREPPKTPLSIAVKMRVSPQYVQQVSRDSGLGPELIAPNTELRATYGFRLVPRRGGAGYAVESEVAVADAGHVWQFHRDRVEKKHTSWGWARDALALPFMASNNLAFRVILDALRSGIRVYNLAPAAIRAEPPIGTAGFLLRDGSNVGDALRHLERNPEDLDFIIRHLGAITPGIVSIKSGIAAGRRLVRFFQGDSRIQFDINDMSDGTLRSLGILVAVRQRPSPAIVCIDEIEDSVHPVAIGVLLDAASASTDRCQILLTSHSPEALSHPAVTAKCIRVIEWRQGRSNIFRVNQGAEQMSRPPRSVGKLLRTNALFTEETPELADDNFWE